MIRLELKNNIIKVLEREALTEGQVNSVPVSFTFSSEWEGLLRIAVFTTGNITRCVILDDTNKCFVPPEVTSHAGDAVFVGVHGTQSDGTVVLPSTNARLEYVRESANPEKDTGSKSLSLWQQVLLELDNVSKIADESSAEIDNMHSEIENIYTKNEVDSLITQTQGEIHIVSMFMDKKYDEFQQQVTETIDKASEQANTDFAKKEHTHAIANHAVENKERISLLGITEIKEQTEISYPSCKESVLQAGGEMPTTFFVNFKGNASIEIKASGMMMNDPLWDAYIDVDGVEIVGEKISDTEAKYVFNGNINNGITITGTYTEFAFVTFSGSRIIYSDGFMSGEQAEQLDNLDTQIGDIDTALDELHNYAQALISGGEA